MRGRAAGLALERSPQAHLELELGERHPPVVAAEALARDGEVAPVGPEQRVEAGVDRQHLDDLAGAVHRDLPGAVEPPGRNLDPAPVAVDPPPHGRPPPGTGHRGSGSRQPSHGGDRRNSRQRTVHAHERRLLPSYADHGPRTTGHAHLGSFAWATRRPARRHSRPSRSAASKPSLREVLRLLGREHGGRDDRGALELGVDRALRAPAPSPRASSSSSSPVCSAPDRNSGTSSRRRKSGSVVAMPEIRYSVSACRSRASARGRSSRPDHQLGEDRVVVERHDASLRARRCRRARPVRAAARAGGSTPGEGAKPRSGSSA